MKSALVASLMKKAPAESVGPSMPSVPKLEKRTIDDDDDDEEVNKLKVNSNASVIS